MPLSPAAAIVLTEENRAAADALCDIIDDWLTRNATRVDRLTVIPMPNHTPRKVQWEISRRYREAGWIGAWFEDHKFVLWATKPDRS
jgi:hypothetical protein